MLQLLRVFVDLGPAHAHDLDQELLDQPVPSQHQCGELGPGR